jgi:hypothetical protein
MKRGATAGIAQSWARGSAAFCFVLICAGCLTPAAQRAANGELPPGRIAALEAEGPPLRVVLISVAGLEASDFLAPGGFVAQPGQPVRMPRLAVLAGEGVVGEKAIVPSPGSIMTSHATLATGRLPTRHGVVADSRPEGSGGKLSFFFDRASLEGEAIWDAAIGRGVLALGWPSTVGARIELLVPELGPTQGEGRWLDRVRRASSSLLVRALEEIEAEALAGSLKKGRATRPPNSWPTAAERDAAFAHVACQVAASERDPGLWLIRMSQTEAAFRSAGSGSAELATALRSVDDDIGTIVDCLEAAGRLADTAIFVVGDVTFRPVHSRVEPNVALVQSGLIGRDPRAATGIRSWLAQVRSHGRSAYVYARDAGNALAARDILESEARKTGAFRVVPATELASGAVDPQAWFGLEAASGFEIGNGLVRPVLRPSAARAREGALSLESGTRETVGFLAWGRGIRSKIRLPELSLADVSPTIAMLLGLRLETPLDGHPLPGILRAAVPPPPPGPKRIGVGDGRDVDRTLQDMGGGRR